MTQYKCSLYPPLLRDIQCAQKVVYSKFQSAKKNHILWFGFPRRNPNTKPISACDISKERKQIPAQIYYLLFLSRGYTLRVIIELIYCIVTFLHTVDQRNLNLVPVVP